MADLTRHWQTSMPQSRSITTGWGGRVADLLTDPARRNDPISMSIAIDRVNTFQTGTNINPYIVSGYGATEHGAYSTDWGPDLIFKGAYEQMLAADDGDRLRQTYRGLTRQAIDAATQYNTATASVDYDTVFPESYLGRSMERVAQTIGAAGTLNQTRQIYFVSVGGWDHHSGLLGPQHDLLREVSQSLGAFHACLTELSLADKVVTFSASDFGRTLAGNGQGSDHGWGGNQFVMGGAVGGGEVYGQYPTSLAIDSPLDVGRGRLIPTTSVDEYAAEIVMWMGIANNADLEMVLPNVRTFYPNSASGAPLGFLA